MLLPEGVLDMKDARDGFTAAAASSASAALSPDASAAAGGVVVADTEDTGVTPAPAPTSTGGGEEKLSLTSPEFVCNRKEAKGEEEGGEDGGVDAGTDEEEAAPVCDMNAARADEDDDDGEDDGGDGGKVPKAAAAVAAVATGGVCFDMKAANGENGGGDDDSSSTFKATEGALALSSLSSPAGCSPPSSLSTLSPRLFLFLVAFISFALFLASSCSRSLAASVGFVAARRAIISSLFAASIEDEDDDVDDGDTDTDEDAKGGDADDEEGCAGESACPPTSLSPAAVTPTAEAASWSDRTPSTFAARATV
mmetsp:Transcript_9884/g.18149  ORF Transcript_9884/g.18149 Transcript_9884/m.18149 type:complete len:310 (+) Transcript_9884:703-1632(+)